VTNEEVIRPVERALSNKPAIVLVRGSLCPDGAIVKMGLATDKKLQFTGRARIFHLADEAVEALRQGRIVKGDVLVLRGLGVKGGPGMGMASRVVFALDGIGLGPDVAVVTDGQLSGLVNKGLVVGEVTPEAAIGGPLGLVEEGDRIVIDIERRVVDLDVPDAEVASRRARFTPPAPPLDNSWLSVYERSVQPLAKGAALVGRK
jgi:dihydroxy-acid dehydratase